MTLPKKPFWEDQYAQKDGLKTFHGGEPTETVRFVVENYLNSGNAVEFGCGAGRDSIYLASKGFQVTSVDVSETGIAKLNEIAALRKLKINSCVRDMRDFEFNGKHDLFVAIGCLHLIPTKDQPELLSRIRTNTRSGGFNVVKGAFPIWGHFFQNKY